MTAISMGPALKILRSRYAAEERAAAETAKLAAEKEAVLRKLKKRERAIGNAISAIENPGANDNDNG